MGVASLSIVDTVMNRYSSWSD